MGDARIGTGIMLKVGDGASPEVFADVAELASLTPSPQTRAVVPVPVHNSPASAKLLGRLDQGPVVAKLYWVPNDVIHRQLKADCEASPPVKRNYRIAYPPDGLPHETFPARVQQWAVPDVGQDTPLEVDLNLEIDGPIVTVYE